MNRALLIFPLVLAFAAPASAQQVATLAPLPLARTAEDLLTVSVLPVAEAIAQKPAVVKAAQNLRPGMLLTAADLIVEGDNPASLDMYVGQEVKRAVYVGKTMSLNDVGPPTAVERNAIVMLEFVRGPMTITTEGRALDSGAVGDRVRIMNLSSKIILTGTITGPNKAVTR
jgi:flagella basal body P-ring formation protein FlgA